jgi:hypothetical protein
LREYSVELELEKALFRRIQLNLEKIVGAKYSVGVKGRQSVKEVLS